MSEVGQLHLRVKTGQHLECSAVIQLKTIFKKKIKNNISNK